MPASVHARAVRRAAELLGGWENLARALGVPFADIEQWHSGERKPPREVFLRVVDIVIDDRGAANEAEPPAPTSRRGNSTARSR